MSKYYIPKEKVEKACAMCGNLFSTAKDRQRFCSQECRFQFVETIQMLGECPKCGADLLGSN